jgi:hypothetical protein
MPFTQDQAFAQDFEPFYGKYHSTFRIAHEQVVAHLFERDGWLVAHISFAPGFDAPTATDAYWVELEQYAKEHGFDGKLKTLLS